MFDKYDIQSYGSSSAAPKYDKLNRPMPSREELLSRNSFGSVNNNRHLDRMLGKRK